MGEQKGADRERRGGAASEGGAEGGWVTNPSPSTRLPDSSPWRAHPVSAWESGMGGWCSNLVALGSLTPALALIQFKSELLGCCLSCISTSLVLFCAPEILYIGFNMSVSTCVSLLIHLFMTLLVYLCLVPL